MTNKEAAHLLRTEQLGDSERMELAKRMGADALERQHTYFIAPKCENCGAITTGITIKYFCGHRNVAAVSNFDPSCCPKCGTYFDRVDINYEEQTCILRGEQHNENNQN